MGRSQLVLAGGVTLQGIDQAEGHLRVRGQLRQGSRTELPVLELTADEHISDAQCSCSHFQHHKLRRGPCSHMLALRLVAQPKIDALRRESPVQPVATAAEEGAR